MHKCVCLCLYYAGNVLQHSNPKCYFCVYLGMMDVLGQNSEILVIDGQCFLLLLLIQLEKSSSCLEINSYDITLTRRLCCCCIATLSVLKYSCKALKSSLPTAFANSLQQQLQNWAASVAFKMRVSGNVHITFYLFVCFMLSWARCWTCPEGFGYGACPADEAKGTSEVLWRSLPAGHGAIPFYRILADSREARQVLKSLLCNPQTHNLENTIERFESAVGLMLTDKP